MKKKKCARCRKREGIVGLGVEISITKQPALSLETRETLKRIGLKKLQEKQYCLQCFAVRLKEIADQTRNLYLHEVFCRKGTVANEQVD